MEDEKVKGLALQRKCSASGRKESHPVSGAASEAVAIQSKEEGLQASNLLSETVYMLPTGLVSCLNSSFLCQADQRQHLLSQPGTNGKIDRREPKSYLY